MNSIKKCTWPSPISKKCFVINGFFFILISHQANYLNVTWKKSWFRRAQIGIWIFAFSWGRKRIRTLRQLMRDNLFSICQDLQGVNDIPEIPFDFLYFQRYILPSIQTRSLGSLRVASRSLRCVKLFKPCMLIICLRHFNFLFFPGYNCPFLVPFTMHSSQYFLHRFVEPHPWWLKSSFHSWGNNPYWRINNT